MCLWLGYGSSTDIPPPGLGGEQALDLPHFLLSRGLWRGKASVSGWVWEYTGRAEDPDPGVAGWEEPLWMAFLPWQLAVVGKGP